MRNTTDPITALAQMRSATRAQDFRDPDKGPEPGFIFVGYANNALKISLVVVAKLEQMHAEWHANHEIGAMFQSSAHQTESLAEHGRILALQDIAELALATHYKDLFPTYAGHDFVPTKGGMIFAKPKDKPAQKGKEPNIGELLMILALMDTLGKPGKRGRDGSRPGDFFTGDLGDIFGADGFEDFMFGGGFPFAGPRSRHDSRSLERFRG
jgi:hypothetical protein